MSAASHTNLGGASLPVRVPAGTHVGSAQANLAPGAARAAPGVLSGPKCRVRKRDLDAIKKMRADGMTWRDIATATGRTLRAMEEIRARHGLAGIGNNVWTAEQVAALYRLHAAGETGVSIAKTLGKTVSAVRQKATWEGISLRKPKAEQRPIAPARPRAQQHAEHLKPAPVVTQAAQRRCLCGCGRMFASTGPGHRIRPECRDVFDNRHTGAV